MSDPLDVTVVIPAYNRADTIHRAVESALGQRPSPPADVIVVDDASIDDTADRAAQAGARVVRLAANSGAGNARNRGAEAAQTKWLTFLDSDDMLLPQALSVLYPHTGRFDIISGVGLIREEDRPDRVQGTAHAVSQVIDDPRRIVFPGNPLPAGGGLVARRALLDVGGYNTVLKYGEDMDLWIRLIEQHPALLLNEPVIVYHRHSGGKSQDTSALAARVAIVESYRDRDWWSPALCERYTAVLHWLTFRDVMRSSDTSGAWRLLAGALSTPTRALAVATVITRHAMMRVRKRGLTTGHADNRSR